MLPLKNDFGLIRFQVSGFREAAVRQNSSMDLNGMNGIPGSEFGSSYFLFYYGSINNNKAANYQLI